jgi:hypothetical protein
MHKLSKGFIVPSAAFSISKKLIKGYIKSEKKPEVGDLVYGTVKSIGQHRSLENREGRIHNIYRGTTGVFVFGNRYAPDYYEGMIPEQMPEDTDLLARSGVVGTVLAKSSKVLDPTKIRLEGYVCDKSGHIINSRNHPLFVPRSTVKNTPRAKMILVVGTAMNAGKSAAAAACCMALSASGYEVRGTKVTGTASLKDILHMNDAGATYYADFTYLGFPSTYMLSREETFHIFNALDLKYANNRDNYWVVELADGINQRETAMLLESEEVQSRIHKLIFCAQDAFGAIGGLEVLKNRFNLLPDAISGVCSSSPLHVKELQEFSDIPVFNSLNVNQSVLLPILTKRKSKVGALPLK